MAGRAITVSNAAKIEQHAQTISDPLDKLRYLRQATAIGQSHRLFKNGLRWMASVIVIVVPLASHANFWRQEAWTLTKATTQRNQRDFPNIWLVEQSNQTEIYSNGVRIENVLESAISVQASAGSQRLGRSRCCGA